MSAWGLRVHVLAWVAGYGGRDSLHFHAPELLLRHRLLDRLGAVAGVEQRLNVGRAGAVQR